MISLIPPHRNLGAFALKIGSRYVGDLTLPFREGWGWSWGRLLRIYWRGHDGRRHWFYLPSFTHHSDRVES